MKVRKTTRNPTVRRREWVRKVAQLKDRLSETSEQLAAERRIARDAWAELQVYKIRYRELLEHAPVAFLVLDRSGCIVHINETGCRLLGYDPRHLVGRPFIVLFARPAGRALLRHIRQCREAVSQPLQTELWIHPPGRPPILLHLTSIYSEGPSPAGNSIKPSSDGNWIRTAFMDVTAQRKAEKELVHARDELEARVDERTVELNRANRTLRSEIEERRQSEKALRGSEAKFRAFVDLAPDGFVISRPDSKVVLINAEAERSFGYSRGELLNKSVDLLTPSRFRRSIRELRLQCFKAPSPAPGSWRVESIAIRKDGTEFPVEWSISRLETNDGVMICSAIRDISERKEAENALKQSEHDLTDFFMHAPIGLLWVGPDGLIRWVNQAQVELLACGVDSCLNRPIAQIFSNPATAAEALARLERRETLQNFRAVFRKADNELRHVLIDANGLWVGGRLSFSRWFVRDITERLALEEEILAAGEREQQRLGRDLHDDLCQQLSGIELLSQTLAGKLSNQSDSLQSQAGEIARLIRESISHTHGLAHGLSPSFSGPHDLVMALKALAARTRQMFRIDCRFLAQHPVRLAENSAGIHLFRIAQEALGNAIKHGKAKRVVVRLTESQHEIVLSVYDNGAGFQTNGSPKGMGLRVMQYRAGVLGGFLRIMGHRLGGTTVICRIQKRSNEDHSRS